MTATDVAKIAQYLIKNYPSLLNITKLTSTTIDGTTVTTINKMLAGQSDAPTQVKIDGLKTGTSDKAGACFVSTGTYQGTGSSPWSSTPLVGVMNGSPKPPTSTA
ncbi:hypothetical protein QPX96_10840 [Limosilactobacillus fermentum]|nr:hypothetical protein [Limosilactobacillus fermentum]